MTTRQRPTDTRPETRLTNPSAADGAPEGESREDSMRMRLERLWEAGDEAINRTLSGDSEAFLRANRQRGGQ